VEAELFKEPHGNCNKSAHSASDDAVDASHWPRFAEQPFAHRLHQLSVGYLIAIITLTTLCTKKHHEPIYFWNYTAKNQPILMIFGSQHPEKI